MKISKANIKKVLIGGVAGFALSLGTSVIGHAQSDGSQQNKTGRAGTFAIVGVEERVPIFETAADAEAWAGGTPASRPVGEGDVAREG